MAMASVSGALGRAQGGAHSPSLEEHWMMQKQQVRAILRIGPGSSVWRTGMYPSVKVWPMSCAGRATSSYSYGRATEGSG